MDREKIKRELGALIQKGMDIFAASYRDYDKNILKNVDAEGEKKLKKIAEKMTDPKGEYYDWYHEACRVIRTFAPERLAEFERFYIGDTTIKKVDDLNLITSGITHYLQEWVIVKGEEKTDFFDNFQSYFKAQRYILMAVVGNIDNKLSNLESDFQYGLSKSEIEVAKELQKNKHLREAGMIAGLVIELHLKNVAKNRNIKLPQNPQMKHYNEKLKNEIDDATITKQIELCSIIRNKCAHAGGALPTDDEVNTIISIAEKIIATVN